MLRYILFGVFGFFLLASTAWALDLSSAKGSGLVGETPSGYLAVVRSNPEAAKLVQSINAQRKQEYMDIAKRNGIDLKAVEQLAGKKAIEKTPAGQFVQMNGAWVKK
ncbi:MAG: YdbL family protein [Desulfobulbaceae bacterium]|nr:YdbL family protein [Desulfobulbaceae bacterium]